MNPPGPSAPGVPRANPPAFGSKLEISQITLGGNLGWGGTRAFQWSCNPKVNQRARERERKNSQVHMEKPACFVFVRRPCADLPGSIFRALKPLKFLWSRNQPNPLQFLLIPVKYSHFPSRPGAKQGRSSLLPPQAASSRLPHLPDAAINPIYGGRVCA